MRIIAQLVYDQRGRIIQSAVGECEDCKTPLLLAKLRTRCLCGTEYTRDGSRATPSEEAIAANRS